MTQSPPAFCPEHGFFPAGGLDIAGARDVNISNVTNTCPFCGQACEVLPGTYNAIPNGFNLLIDPSISIQALMAIKVLADRVQRQEITVKQAQQQAENIAPGTGKFFNVREWSDQAKATLYAGVLASATALAIAAYASRGSGDVTNNYYYSSPPTSVATDLLKPNVKTQNKLKGNRKFDLLKAGKIPLPKRKPKKRP